MVANRNISRLCYTLHCIIYKVSKHCVQVGEGSFYKMEVQYVLIIQNIYNVKGKAFQHTGQIHHKNRGPFQDSLRCHKNHDHSHRGS